MGYITIETITNSKECFAFEIESESRYEIDWMGRIVVLPDKTSKICMFQNMLVILTESEDFKDSFQSVISFETRGKGKNNILALDSYGKLLWNIGSIVGDVKKPFVDVSCIFKDEAEKRYGVALPCDTEILLECNAEKDVYLIDPIDKKVLYKLVGKC